MNAEWRRWVRGVTSTALALAALDCSSGEALEGDVHGDYDGQTFEPLYGVAIDTHNDAVESTLEIQLSAEPLDCENHITVGSNNPAGLYLVLRLDSAKEGAFEDVYIEYENLSPDGSAQLGGFGSVELTSVTDDAIAGTVAFLVDQEGRPHASAEGSFEVRRCSE